MKSRIFLSIGSNKGDRMKFILRSLPLIRKEIGEIVNTSSVYESNSWGYDDEPYLNCVTEVMSDLKAEDILDKIQKIEKETGRKHKTKIANDIPVYSSREIDIDILFLGNTIIESEKLTIPHKQLHKRKFVLIPLHEISPDLIHPVFNKSVNELLETCTDNGEVIKYSVINPGEFM